MQETEVKSAKAPQYFDQVVLTSPSKNVFCGWMALFAGRRCLLKQESFTGQPHLQNQPQRKDITR